MHLGRLPRALATQTSGVKVVSEPPDAETICTSHFVHITKGMPNSAMAVPDALAAASFDPLAYINDVFPTQESLTQVDGEAGAAVRLSLCTVPAE